VVGGGVVVVGGWVVVVGGVQRVTYADSKTCIMSLIASHGLVSGVVQYWSKKFCKFCINVKVSWQ
jgi:hypothetical protein